MRKDAEATSVLADLVAGVIAGQIRNKSAIVENAIASPWDTCFPVDKETISRHTVKRDG